MFRPVLLWTDALLFLLIAGLAAFAWHVRRTPHLREPWGRVARSRTGMCAAVVLAAYALVGVADSLHFRLPAAQGPDGRVHWSAEVLSVLDLALARLREGAEKTYSAPLAVRLHVKETVERPDGTRVRERPRLRYGGAHLADPDRERWPDVARRALAGAAAGLALWAGAAALLAAALARRWRLPWRAALARLAAGRTELPWRPMLVTAAALAVLAGAVAALAGGYHVLGTDKVGEDVLYQALKSVRTGLVIGTLTTLLMLPFALAMGLSAGYFGGRVDDLVQYLYTTLNSIPGVLLIAAGILMLQVYMANHPEPFETTAARADLRLLFLCAVLGVTSWTGLCRMLRGETLKLREVEYVQAAVALGTGHGTILVRHVLPNVLHIVLISVVLDFSALVLAEAVLAYVGVGVDPTMTSWGNMINSARLELAREPVVWWTLAAAFVFMLGLVLAANLFADAVREAFDPRRRVR